jgi:uncharacterized phage protein (TIGR01671 family)
MRDIKFRVWNGNRMEKVREIHFSDDPIYSKVSGNISAWHPIKRIMQFTGLHDKNGKEIYEGDILKCDIGGFEHLAYVIYQYGHFRIRKIEYDRIDENGLIEFDLSWDHPYLLKVDNNEVIGNIYKNPEFWEN